MHKPIFVRHNKLPYLETLAQELGFDFSYRLSGQRDIALTVSDNIVIELEDAKRLTGITIPYQTAQKNSNILFGLYSCNQLTVNGFIFSTYHNFRQQHRDFTLDHILPKKYFPNLTFESSNLKPVKLKDNLKKGDDLLSVKQQALDHIDELLALINSYQ